MENSLLNRIPFDPIYILLALSVLIVILFIMLISTRKDNKRINNHLKTFMRGKDGKSLEDSMEDSFRSVDKVNESMERQKVEMSDIRNRVSGTYRKTGIVKYDAFQEMGGELSFALTLLDENNTGFILNAMHSREGCFTYIKEIIKGESFIALSEEEDESLSKAMRQE